MRWLTREWWSGDLVGPEYEAATLHYALNLERIMPSLPLPLRVLAGIDLHDALFDDVSVDEDERLVTMRLVAGDVERSYVFLTLTYHSGGFVATDLPEVERLVNGRETEILVQEVDMAFSGRFEHRLLLWPEGELEVQCSNLSLAMTPARERKRRPAFVRFRREP
jgi:hypothetical protein